MTRHLVDADHWLDGNRVACRQAEAEGRVRYRPECRAIEVVMPDPTAPEAGIQDGTTIHTAGPRVGIKDGTVHPQPGCCPA